MQMSIVKHNYLQLHCPVVPHDHSELERIWEQRGDDRQPSLVFENSRSQCQSHPFRESSVRAQWCNPETRLKVHQIFVGA
jgi:hypothetical protein